jgi:hypothetical protein
MGEEAMQINMRHIFTDSLLDGDHGVQLEMLVQATAHWRVGTETHGINLTPNYRNTPAAAVTPPSPPRSNHVTITI